MNIIAYLVLGWLLMSTALTVGTFPGGWIDSVSPPVAPDGRIDMIWLPFGTMVDIDGVRFKVCLDADPPYGIYLYQPGWGVVDRGTELRGHGVEVYIIDYWFAGRPAIAGMYLATVVVNRPSLNLGKPLVFSVPELDVYELAGEKELRLTSVTGGFRWVAGTVPSSYLVVTGEVVYASLAKGVFTRDRAEVDVIVRAEWSDGTVDVQHFLLSPEVQDWASETKAGNKFSVAIEHPRILSWVKVKVEVWLNDQWTLWAEHELKWDVKDLTPPVYEEMERHIEDIQSGILEITKELRIERAEEIKAAIEKFFNEVYLPRENEIIEWVENIRDSLRDALGELADEVSTNMQVLAEAFENRLRILYERLTEPHVTLYVPPSIPSGLPTEFYFETQNAEIVSVEVRDLSGTLFSGAATRASVSPREGAVVDLTVTYRGIYDNAENTVEMEIPVTFQQGYFLDESGMPRSLTEYLARVTVFDVMVISGIAVVAAAAFLRWRGIA